MDFTWGVPHPATHEGDPFNWSVDFMRSWLQHHTGQPASALEQLSRQSLLQQVNAEIDPLYSRYKPKFNHPYHQNLSSLHLWVPYNCSERRNLSEIMGEMTPAQMSMMPRIPPTTKSGELTPDFNPMYNPGELMYYAGKTQTKGCGPAEDLRLNLLMAAMAIDQGQERLFYQTTDHSESLCVFVRKIVLLLPQSKFKPGDKVIVIKTHKQKNKQSSSSIGSSSGDGGSSSNDDGGVPAPGSMGTVAEQQQRQSDKIRDSQAPIMVPVLFDGSSTPLQVPASHLLPIRPLDESQQPFREGEYVVVHGLQQQAHLSGSLARVQKMPDVESAEDSSNGGSSSSSAKDGASSSNGSADQRCHLTLVPFLADAASGGISEQKQQINNLHHIAPRMSCIAPVVQPQCALLIAFASHNDKTPANHAASKQFLMSQAQHMLTVVPISTTPREHGLLVRHIQQCKDMLGHCNSKLWTQLRGDLSANHWTLGLFVPVKPPMTDAEQQRRLLKKEKKCRQCDKASSKYVKLRPCSGCQAVWYCSRECQVADWKARHKRECAAKKAAAEAETGDNSGCVSRVEGDSVWIAMTPPTAGPYKGQYIMSIGGHRMDMNKTPANKHGDSEFLVKISNLGPVSIRDVQIHDQARTFLWYVEEGHIGHDKLMAIVKRIGRTNDTVPDGRAAFLRAKRESVYLRLFTNALPDQRQPW